LTDGWSGYKELAGREFNHQRTIVLTATIRRTSPGPASTESRLGSNDGFSVPIKAPSNQIICRATWTSSPFASIGVMPLFVDGCFGDFSNTLCKQAL